MTIEYVVYKEQDGNWLVQGCYTEAYDALLAMDTLNQHCPSPTWHVALQSEMKKELSGRQPIM